MNTFRNGTAETIKMSHPTTYTGGVDIKFSTFQSSLKLEWIFDELMNLSKDKKKS